MSYGIMWLAAIVLFVVLEACTYQFICIWFAGGALGAFVAYSVGADIVTQTIVFLAVAVILLIFTRPFVKKITRSKQSKTNVESLPGSVGQVTECINNIQATGKVKINGMEWTARSGDNSIIQEGNIVEVTDVSGVKLIVIERKDD